MTEKRFICIFDEVSNKHCVQNTNSLDIHPVADEKMGNEFAHLLNLSAEAIDKIEKENYRLKKENQKLLTLSNIKKGALVEAVKDLTKENEQLKKENKELRQYLGWQEMELEELEDIDKNVIR